MSVHYFTDKTEQWINIPNGRTTAGNTNCVIKDEIFHLTACGRFIRYLHNFGVRPRKKQLRITQTIIDIECKQCLEKIMIKHNLY